MMHPLLRFLALATVLFLFTVSDSTAQSLLRPFHLQSGYATALAKARDTLASDAYLVYAGTLGGYELDLSGVALRVNYYQDPDGAAEAGMADAWGYVFYSPSLQRNVNLVVVNTFFTGGYFATGVEINLPLPTELTDNLDLNIPGAHSSSVIAVVRGNAIYTAYHNQYPEKQPNFVTLGIGLPPDVDIPPGFAPSGPTWTYQFDGGGDTSSMVCMVSASSGAAACQLFAASAVPIDRDAATTLSMRALPNPSSGMLRIVLGDDVQLRGEISMELLDARGAHVLDLAPSLRANNLQNADADVTHLAPGIYFCRITIDGVGHVAPVSIAR
ncbi:MAG: T9SS type A sorting domain-containing protein [bacterium]|nr:T9SS type A sorting domain-containing protein [Candidatus Kapabacteria bacterium]